MIEKLLEMQDMIHQLNPPAKASALPRVLHSPASAALESNDISDDAASVSTVKRMSFVVKRILMVNDSPPF